MPRRRSRYADSGASAAAQSAQDVYASLEKLAKLREQGVLNDAEYSKMKAELLEKA